MDNSLALIPLDPEILNRTPPEVIALLLALLERIRVLEARVEELEAKLNKNSTNSNKPPSSDSAFAKVPDKPKKPKKPRKRKGVRQQCLRPTELVELFAEQCSCGSHTVEEQEPYYIHQVIDLPQTQPIVRHIFLYRGRCQKCGKTVKAHIPHEQRTGFGPRLCALIAEFVAVHGNSRSAVQDFLLSVHGIPISQGAIQNILDRIRLAIAPHYEAIGEAVRSCAVNHVDETSWKRKKTLEWLWLMCNNAAAFFMIHNKRSKAAFDSLVKDWQGILISDGYGVYRRWAHGRQSCLAHLIREAKGLSERQNPALSGPGTWALKELRLLCRMAKTRPSVGQWNMFYARLIRLIALYGAQPNEAGKFVRRLQREIDCLWLFLQEKGVAPTNNHAERTLRYAVLWRKRSFGTRVAKGDSFVERILSLRQTCRLQGKRTFPVLVRKPNYIFSHQMSLLLVGMQK
jgi:transposase